MLKKYELLDAIELHPYLLDESVYPYVRHKAQTLDEYLFITQGLLEREEKGELVLRVILDENEKSIGQIALFDIQNHTGFLATWIGTPFQGKGYNRKAKDQFLSELFYGMDFDIIYIKIRKTNEKSKKATLKIPYIHLVNESNSLVYQLVNKDKELYDVFEITKECYQTYITNTIEK